MLIGGEGAAAAAFSAPRFGWFWCTGCVGHKPQPVRKIHSTESNIAVSKEPGLDFTSSLLYYDERARETAEENLYGLIISAKAALSVDICVRESERERKPGGVLLLLLSLCYVSARVCRRQLERRPIVGRAPLGSPL
jgi:hypothetical protein